MRKVNVTVRGPLGLLLGLVIIILWLVAIFFPTIVILSIAAGTDSLDKPEVWLTVIILQGLWWWMSDAYS